MSVGNAGLVSQAFNGIHCDDDETVAGDIISGILCGYDVLATTKANLKFTRVLVLVTDGESQIDADGVSDLEQVLTQMQQSGEQI